MRVRGYQSNDYAEISKHIPPYTARQIRQFWTNQLDPRLCHDNFEKEEIDFIIQWIEDNITSSGSISWIDLIDEVQRQFGKLRSKNKIKNFWYSLRRRSRPQAVPSTSTVNTTYNPLITNHQIPTFRPIPDQIHTNLWSNPSTFRSNLDFWSNYNQIPAVHPNSDKTFTDNPNQIPTLYPTHNQIPITFQPYSTLQPNPDPPRFNLPYKMNPI
ncbi:hypothetical protein C1645_804318 [Glomus cerebriforme]|uniref:HTH myb-type domain-containing protein n=1 Tax=Glomus cerebriforme TaxID=658196 RepID=A0A397T430_9GLOM|nr:hypothetical protein C1645_804318 [Glomus cerebriforme]